MAISPVKIFLGSSSERRAIAEDLERRLSPLVLIEPWWNLPEGDTILGALLQKAAECDMAVFVLAPDDIASRGSKRNRFPIARDNVIYELGLFAGAVDPTNSLMLVDEKNPLSLPSDLQGVIQLRWRSDTPDTMDHAVKKILAAAERYSERRGLGWWIIKSINLSVTPREFYGVFEVVRSGKDILVRYGKLYYGRVFPESELWGKEREQWHSGHAKYIYEPGQGSRIIVLAEVSSLARDRRDTYDKAHTVPKFGTLYEAQQISPDGLYQGMFFNVFGLENRGIIKCRRLGFCTEDEATARAKDEFSA